MTQSRYQKPFQATIAPAKVHHSHLFPTIMNADQALCQVFDFRQCAPTLANHMLEGRARHLECREGKVGVRGRRQFTGEAFVCGVKDGGVRGDR